MSALEDFNELLKCIPYHQSRLWEDEIGRIRAALSPAPAGEVASDLRFQTIRDLHIRYRDMTGRLYWDQQLHEQYIGALINSAEWMIATLMHTSPASPQGGEVKGWQPIETARNDDRVIVAGWQPRHGNVAGYWWFHDDSIVDGKPFLHPDATLWHPYPSLPEPTDV